MKYAGMLVFSISLGLFTSDSVFAVSEAELKELERQIEKQEAEVQRIAEEKRKAAEERERQAELEKMRLEQKQRQAEEERWRQEQQRLAEEERIRQEEEARTREENEKKQKYEMLVEQAERAIREKDKDLAISKFNDALLLFPDDRKSMEGIGRASALKDKFCYEVLGGWENTYAYTIEWELLENGSTRSNLANPPTWTCEDPEKRRIRLSWGNAYSVVRELNEDGRCLCLTDTSIEKKRTCSIVGDACYLRRGQSSSEEPVRGNRKDSIRKLFK